MPDPNFAACWNKAAKDAVFTHPLDAEAFLNLVPKNGRIVDVGCGYGRIMKELAALGCSAMTGLDVSPEMIARGKREAPGLDLRVWPGGALPLRDEKAEAALLFAVLNCIPKGEDQKRLMNEIWRVLSPGGVLYVSDYPIQEDARNQRRYREARPHGAPFGVFALPDGSMFRHHPREWINGLFSGFNLLDFKEVSVSTMKGNPAQAFQAFLEKPRP